MLSMKNIIRIAVVLMVSCASWVGIAWAVGHAQPATTIVLFTNPDGTPCERPCLFGIRVGKTSYTRAIDLLRLHPFTYRFEPNIEGNILRGESMNIILSLDDKDRISYIELTNRDNTR